MGVPRALSVGKRCQTHRTPKALRAKFLSGIRSISRKVYEYTTRAPSRRLYIPRHLNESAAHNSALHYSQLASSTRDKSVRVMEDSSTLSSEPAVEIVRA